MNKILKLIPLLATAFLLACGGGGGGGDGGVNPPPPLPTDPAAAQGFWSGQIDAQTTVSAVLLPDGSAWNVVRSGPTATVLARGTTTVLGNAFTVMGQGYNLAGGVPGPYMINGTLASKATLTVSGQASTTYTLAYNKFYETPARLSDVAGRWNASFGSGSVQLALDFSATGTLSGSSSTGCSYSGSVVPHPASIAVFNLNLAETCPGTPAQQFAGIATLNEARTQLSAAFTTPSQSAGGLFLATR